LGTSAIGCEVARYGAAMKLEFEGGVDDTGAVTEDRLDVRETGAEPNALLRNESGWSATKDMEGGAIR
jgi:hypothetical protein